MLFCGKFQAGVEVSINVASLLPAQVSVLKLGGTWSPFHLDALQHLRLCMAHSEPSSLLCPSITLCLQNNLGQGEAASTMYQVPGQNPGPPHRFNLSGVLKEHTSLLWGHRCRDRNQFMVLSAAFQTLVPVDDSPQLSEIASCELLSISVIFPPQVNLGFFFDTSPGHHIEFSCTCTHTHTHLRYSIWSINCQEMGT